MPSITGSAAGFSRCGFFSGWLVFVGEFLRFRLSGAGLAFRPSSSADLLAAVASGLVCFFFLAGSKVSRKGLASLLRLRFRFLRGTPHCQTDQKVSAAAGEGKSLQSHGPLPLEIESHVGRRVARGTARRATHGSLLLRNRLDPASLRGEPARRPLATAPQKSTPRCDKSKAQTTMSVLLFQIKRPRSLGGTGAFMCCEPRRSL
jgi:hypothetical protein